MLKEKTLFGDVDKTKAAIQVLRDLVPPEGYYVAFSGGKDSIVIQRLVEMVKRGYPQRQARWCCADYKENGGAGRLVITGVRRAESSKRANRRLVEACYKDATKRYLNIIIDWSDAEVWEFIKENKMPYCKLYDEGWQRIGCLFCPMARPRYRAMEVARYPKYAQQFRKAFVKLYKKKKSEGKTSVDRWPDGNAMFDYWLAGEGGEKVNPDQGVLFE